MVKCWRNCKIFANYLMVRIIHIEIIFISCAIVKFKYPVLSRLNIMLLVHEVLISDLAYNFTKRRPDVPEI